MGKFLKKILKVAAALLVLFCFTIGMMYMSFEKDKSVKNGFDRKRITLKSTFLRQIKLESKYYRFSPMDSMDIIIYDFLNPITIKRISTLESDPIAVNLNIPQIPGFEGPGFVFINGDDVQVVNRYTAKGYEIKIGSSKYTQTKLNNSLLGYIDAITPNSFVLMGPERINDTLVVRALNKVNWKGQPLRKNLPKGQLDQFISNDGFFSYNKENNKIIYTYYYSGKFLCLDTNLNLLYRANTIDTNRTAQLNIKTTKEFTDKKSLIKSGQTKPPKFVNKSLSTYKNLIYLHSHLKADNEDRDTRSNNYVIDTYFINNGGYAGSFYIPRLKRKEMSYFKVVDNKLYAISDDILAIYKLER